MFVVIVPLWLGLFIWLLWYPQRRQNRYAAAKAAAAQHELLTVAAMPDAMREQYWRRKAAGGEDLAHVKPPSQLPIILWWLFVFAPLLWICMKVLDALFGGAGGL
jgi:hypothetical protein